MSFIPKEVPTGVIDGTNTVFTFLNDIDYITSLYIDGAIYVDFIRDGERRVILTDAPTSTIFGDYYTTNSILPIVTNTTLGDVKNKIWRLLGVQAQTSSGNFSTDILTDEINDFMSDLWRGKVQNRLSGKMLESGNMFFQQNYYSFRISKTSSLTAEASVGDTSISMITDGINEAGWLMIGGDYIQYTSTTDTTIEGVSGITTKHDSGVSAIQLYQMPENYDIIVEMDRVDYYYGGVNYAPILDEGRVKFDVIRVGSVPLLQIQGVAVDSIIRTKYNTRYVDLSDDNEDFPLPDRYGNTVVAYAVAGNMGYDKLMPQGERNLTSAYSNLLQMWNFYTKTTQSKTKIRPKSYSEIGRTTR